MPQEGRTLQDLSALGRKPAEAEKRQGAAAPASTPHEAKLDAQGRAYATGKRKDAVARVWIKPGTGKVTVNGREGEKYFARPVLRMLIAQPLAVTNRAGQYDIVA